MLRNSDFKTGLTSHTNWQKAKRSNPSSPTDRGIQKGNYTFAGKSNDGQIKIDVTKDVVMKFELNSPA